MTKKRKDNGNAGEDEHSKSLKVAEQLSPSPPRLGFENPLLPLANTYDDDDDDEDEDEEQYHGRREQNGRGGGVGDTRAIVGQYGHGGRHDDDDDEDDDEDEHGQGKRSRLVEVRRDCPYLDTVNRQVSGWSFCSSCCLLLAAIAFKGSRLLRESSCDFLEKKSLAYICCGLASSIVNSCKRVLEAPSDAADFVMEVVQLLTNHL